MSTTAQRRTPADLRKMARNFARTNGFNDKTTLLKFYNLSRTDPGFDRLGIRVYDLAEVVGERLKLVSSDVAFGDFKRIDYSIFRKTPNIGPNTFAVLNGLQMGIADNAKADKSDTAIAEGLAKLEALAGPLRAEELVKEIIAETPVPSIRVQEAPLVPPSGDDAAYDLGLAAGQARAYLNVLKMLSGRLSAEPESASTIVGLIKVIAGMHELAVGR